MVSYLYICRSFIEESHAGIKISPQDNNYAGLHDRLVTVTGSFDQQMRAIFLILSKLLEDAHYPPSLSSPFPYAGISLQKIVISSLTCLLYGVPVCFSPCIVIFFRTYELSTY